MIISAGFVASYALLLAGLAIFVSLGRISKKISLGDNGDRELLRRQRAHGNSVEHAVVMIPLVILYEMRDGALHFLAAIAALFLIVRVIHAFALIERTNSLARRVTAGITYLLEITLAIALFLTIL